MRRFAAFVWMYALSMFVGYLWLNGMYLGTPVVHAQSSRTFYIDYVSGSNSNNGTSESTAWKSAPPMIHSAGCDNSSGPTYSHQAGDQFVFKGGATWPAACFGMTFTAGGTASAQDYYGTCGGQSTAPSACGGATWPSTGWTRPIFDMQGTVVGTPYGYQVMAVPPNGSAQYITIDDIEIKNQQIGGLVSGGGYRNQCAIGFGSQGPISVEYDVGTIVENVYIHAMSTTVSTGVKPYPNLGYCAGGINGVALVDHVEINGDDSSNNGTTPTTSNWLFFAGGTLEVGVVQYSKIHGTINGCDMYGTGGTQRICHDNEFYHVSNAGEDSTGVHSHIIYDNDGGDNPSLLVYNNAVHDNNAGLNISVDSQAWVYNNVLWNNLNNAAIYGGCESRGTCPSTDTTYVFNNTMDMTANGDACLTSVGTVGVTYIYNNICISPSGLGSIAATTTHTDDKYNMTTSEADQYGFVAANKYSPTSSDPNVAGQGTNETSLCSGNLLNLCKDTSGAPWFGGSYKARPNSASWDLGSYQGTGASGYSIVNHIACGTGGASCTTSSLTVTAGHALVAYAWTYDTSSFSTYSLKITDTSGSNVWKVSTAARTSAQDGAVYEAGGVEYVCNAAGGTYTFTLTPTFNNGSSGFAALGVAEVAGVSNSAGTGCADPSVASAATNTTANPSITSGSVSHGADFIFGGLRNTGANAGVPQQTDIESWSQNFDIEWTTGPASGTQTMGWSSPSGFWLGGVLGLNPAGVTTPPPAFVTGGENGLNNASSCQVSSLSGTNPGDLMVVGVFVWNSTSVSVKSITDTQGNNFAHQIATQQWASNLTDSLYYALNIAGGADTITVTMNATVQRIECYAYDYSGLNRSSPIDGMAAMPVAGTGTSATSGSVTAGNSNDLLFAFFQSDGGATNTAVSPFTGRNVGSSYPLAEDYVAASPGSYSATMSFSQSADYVGFLVAFKQ